MNQESWNIRIKTFFHVGHLEGEKMTAILNSAEVVATKI